MFTRSRWVSFLFCVVGLLSGVVPGIVPKDAEAVLVVQPTLQGGSASGVSSGGTTFHYFVRTSLFNGSVADPVFLFFSPIDVTQSSASDPTLANQVEVAITSNADYTGLTGTQQAVVTFQAFSASTTGTVSLSPIASVNGIPCNDSICQGRSVTTGRYTAAKFYPNNSRTIRIGFYLKDICTDYTTLVGGSAAVCPGGTSGFLEPVADKPSSIPLTFSVFIAPDAIGTTVPTTTGAKDSTTAITFSMGIDTPSLGCPDAKLLNSSYRPGQEKIYFTPNGFGLPNKAGAAPAVQMVVVGRENSDPSVASDFRSANTIFATISPAPFEQELGGFENSNNDKQHSYYMNFLVLNAAGLYAAAPNDCILGPVQASKTNGFLNKGNCFIATATYGSGESPPVLMLRQFRDRVG